MKAGFPAVLVAQEALHRAAVATAGEVDKKFTDIKTAKPETPRPKILLVDSLEIAQGDLPRLEIQAQFALLESGLQTHRQALEALRA